MPEEDRKIRYLPNDWIRPLTPLYLVSRLGRRPIIFYLKRTLRVARRSIPTIEILALGWLLLLTLLAASSSFRGVSPIDARTNDPLATSDVVLETPPAAIVVEPLSALATIIVGAPDYRVAAISTACWLLAGSVLFYGMSRRHTGSYFRIANSCIFALGLTLSFAIYLCAFALVQLPSWFLAAKDPGSTIADLHSHTIASHDGIATLDENLNYHGARGYNVVAITEHFSKYWRSNPCRLGSNATPGGTICGVEIPVGSLAAHQGYLLLLGIPPDQPLLHGLLSDYESGRLAGGLQGFVASVHDMGGAIIALSYQLNTKAVDLLARAGVDGFEIANFGHPDISEELKSALLTAQTVHHVALVASSDWHGWGGFGRTWTLLTADASMSGTRSEKVIQILRSRDAGRIIPVVSQVMGRPTLLRGIFAPFIETIRYARGLSPYALASWWIWMFMWLGVGRYLRRNGYHVGRCFAGAILMILGGGLLIRSSGLLRIWMMGAPFPFPLEIAAYGCAVGIVSVSLACACFWRSSEVNVKKRAAEQIL